jgi:hypothetical protein
MYYSAGVVLGIEGMKAIKKQQIYKAIERMQVFSIFFRKN